MAASRRTLGRSTSSAGPNTEGMDERKRTVNTTEPTPWIKRKVEYFGPFRSNIKQFLKLVQTGLNLWYIINEGGDGPQPPKLKDKA